MHASDIASGSHIVAALCHYSLAIRMLIRLTSGGLSALRSCMCVENPRDPAPFDSCPAHGWCVVNRASQPNEIEFGAYQFVQKGI
jgi:hypothetical protein